MRGIWLFAVALLLMGSDVKAMTLTERLYEARVGDYLVTMQGRTYTLLLVRGRSDAEVQIEEVVVPECVKNKGSSWRTWFERGAKNHTSWMVYSIDLSEGRVKRCYSFSRGGWVDFSSTDHFLSTLLNLNFLPIVNRKRVGPAPAFGQPDTRPEWNPQLVYQGVKVKDASFVAYEGLWPKDGTELAGRRVTIYLPARGDLYPAHFPYWIEMSPTLPDGKVRVVDSGSHLHSPQPLLHTGPHTG